MTTMTTPYDVAEHLRTTEEMAAYLEACIEEADGDVGLPRFQGQVDRGHAMTTRLSIDDQPDQNPSPVHAAAEGGGRGALLAGGAFLQRRR